MCCEYFVQIVLRDRRRSPVSLVTSAHDKILQLHAAEQQCLQR